MTTLQLLVAVIGLLVGFGSQAYNTGSLFGQITVPKPWVGLFVTFATAFVAVLAKAPRSTRQPSSRPSSPASAGGSPARAPMSDSTRTAC